MMVFNLGNMFALTIRGIVERVLYTVQILEGMGIYFPPMKTHFSLIRADCLSIHPIRLMMKGGRLSRAINRSSLNSPHVLKFTHPGPLCLER